MTYCTSTHGGAGYAYGSYWDGYDIICGGCGYRIKNPAPTGGRWVAEKGFWNRLFGRGHDEYTWPDFIKGERGKPSPTNSPEFVEA